MTAEGSPWPKVPVTSSDGARDGATPQPTTGRVSRSKRRKPSPSV